MSLFFLLKSRSVIAAAIGAIRPYIVVFRDAELQPDALRTLTDSGDAPALGGGPLEVQPRPSAHVIKPRRGGVPLG